MAYPAPSVDPCSPQPPNRYRCTGDPVQGGDGWWYFDYCESNGAITNVPYTSTSVPFSGQVTKTGTSIQVVNCSYQDGVAGYLSDALVAEGFTMIKPDTGTINLPVTKVIYNPDDPAALAVAQTVALLLGNAVVEPSGPEVPSLTGAWAPGSSVIVLLGDDLVGKTLAQIAGGDTVTATTTVGP